MKMHLAAVAMFALGFPVGCTREAADSKPTSQPAQAPAKEPRTPDATPKKRGIESVDAAGAAKLIAENDGAIILDIRTPDEFQRGHLKGALNIDYKAADYAEKLGALDKEKTYLVH